MPESPRVSVFIASYNHAQFLPECLESILSQTYHDFEIVIVDDGSTDGSHEILTDYQRCFPKKIFYFWHPGHVNKGISASCNLAISKTKGEYLAWIGSDDIWYPNKLEKQVGVLENSPEVGLVYSPVNIIENTGIRVLGIIGTNGVWGMSSTNDTDLVAHLIEENTIPAPTVIVRRECLAHVGHFDEALVYSDWELWLRILAHWKASFVDTPLALYRIHGQNISVGKPEKIQLNNSLEVMLALREKAAFIGGAFLNPNIRNLLNHQSALISLKLAEVLFNEGNTDEAIQKINLAFSSNPEIGNDPEYCFRLLYRDSNKMNCPKQCFVFWALKHLPRNTTLRFRKQLTGLIFRKAAFGYYIVGNMPLTRKMIVRCIINDPIRWFENKGLVSILLESIIGISAMNQARRFKRKIEKLFY